MALINCPECDHTVSDRATSCPKCGFPLNGVSNSKVNDQEPNPSEAFTPTQREKAVITKVWKSSESQTDNTLEHKPLISPVRFAIGMIINLFVSGAGWILAPAGHKLFGLALITAWLLMSLFGSETVQFLAIVLNIISAVIFGSRFRNYVGKT